MADTTDHELLLLMQRDIRSLTIQLEKALEQLDKGNQRFQEMALQSQEIGIRIETLIQNQARAMLSAEQANAKADSAVLKANEVEKDFGHWKSILRWTLGLITAIVIALLIELLKRSIFP